MAMNTASNTATALAESRSLLDDLVSPVAGATAKHRIKIIDRVADLFAAGSRSYSDEQISLFDDVLRRLTVDIEVKARAKLAHRLAAIDNAPPCSFVRSRSTMRSRLLSPSLSTPSG